jgi:hypothetical protein
MAYPMEFARDEYYSESQARWLKVSDLPLPYVRNIFFKMAQYDDFAGSPLCNALLRRLRPPPVRLYDMLRLNGIASYWLAEETHLWDDPKAVRAKFYRLGKDLGRKVKTHKNGDFLEAECEADKFSVKVKA